jgi:gamma-glutamylcyclotransferase (GGCT)/AIG2-like uncharacterized protein YtfP
MEKQLDEKTGEAALHLPIFVYGTLLPGQPNAYLWGDGVAEITTAWFENGRLYDCGYYPMLVEETAALPVKGQLVTPYPDRYQAVLARIDALEGYGPDEPEAATYRRVRRQVRLGQRPGPEQPLAWAWVYVGQPAFVTDLPPIHSGDWVAYAVARHRQMSDWWRTIRTVAGRHGS